MWAAHCRMCMLIDGLRWIAAHPATALQMEMRPKHPWMGHCARASSEVWNLFSITNSSLDLRCSHAIEYEKNTLSERWTAYSTCWMHRIDEQPGNFVQFVNGKNDVDAKSGPNHDNIVDVFFFCCRENWTPKKILNYFYTPRATSIWIALEERKTRRYLHHYVPMLAHVYFPQPQWVLMFMSHCGDQMEIFSASVFSLFTHSLSAEPEKIRRHT